MKKIFLMLLGILLLATCQKAPELTVTGQDKVDISDAAYSFTVFVKSNRAWTAKPSDHWVRVSPPHIPAATDHSVEVTISVDRNDTYDERSATVVFFADEATREVKVRQTARRGVIIPGESGLFDISAEESTIVVEVQANVDYEIVLPKDCDWLEPVSSKALPAHHHSFLVAQNGTRHGREASIKFVNEAEHFEGVAVVRQAFFPILVSKDTILASGRGWTASFETAGPDADAYNIVLEDRWLSLEGNEKTQDGGTRFFVSAAACGDGAGPRESRVMVYYRGLPEPDTLLIRQSARLSAVSFSTSGQVVKLPEVKGDGVRGFVFWGDGTNEIWGDGLQHSYSSDGPHDVTIELEKPKRVDFTEVKNDMAINFKEMRK